MLAHQDFLGEHISFDGKVSQSKIELLITMCVHMCAPRIAQGLGHRFGAGT